MISFSFNSGTLFGNVPLLDRFRLAARAGFVAVESWWPEDIDLDAFAGAIRDAGLQLVLLNFYGGRLAEGDRGLAGDIERSQEFRDNVPLALELGASLGCRRMHALIGKEQPGQDRDDQLQLAVENLRWTADLAARNGATVLVEPLNRFDNGPCLIQHVSDAIDLIRRIGRSNVGVQFDTYHVMRTERGLPERIRGLGSMIRHVQFADAPGRGRPGSGGVDFGGVFEALSDIGFDGFIGLEYLAQSDDEDALAWLPSERRAEPQSLDELRRWWATRR